MGNVACIAKNKEVKKHTSAVHSAGQLTLLQRKISNSLLYHAYNQLLMTEEHEVTVGALCKLIGYSGNNYDVVKQSLKGLISTVVEWNVLDEGTGEEDWSASAILASARIKGSRCFYAYSPRMKELLSSPTMYAKINLYIQSKFHSSYGLALYENCIRYRGLHSTKWFELALFRKLMGVEEGTYKLFNDLKKRVIDKAIDEVNMYSDIKIRVDYGRVGRKVVKLRFLLQEREKKKKLGASSGITQNARKSEQPNLGEQIQGLFGLSALHAERLVTQYDQQYLLEKIQYVQTTKVFQSKQGNIAAYFVAAVKNDYKSSKEVISTVVEQKKQADKKGEGRKEAYRRYCIAETIRRVYALEHDKRKRVLDDFQQKISQGKFGGLYQEQGLENPLIQDEFYLFAREKKLGVLVKLMGYEAWAIGL